MAPRLSIVPAAALFDPRLKPRDRDVLWLLGTHVSVDNGWCRRSQVKMARELRVSRGTVQASINRLVEAGWVERRTEQNQHGGDAAHHYRVLLDTSDVQLDGVRKAMAAAANGEENDPVDGDEGADSHTPPCQPGWHPPASPELAPPASPGLAPMNDSQINVPPLPPQGGERESAGATLAERENDPVGERDPLGRPDPFGRSDPLNLGEWAEREAREAATAERDADAGLDAFLAAWPVKSDLRGKCVAPWAALSAAERVAATARIEPFLAEERRAGRKATIAASTYLRERAWARIEPPAPAAGKPGLGKMVLRPWGKDWWWLLWWHTSRGDAKAARLMIENATRGIGYGVAVELVPTAAVLGAMASVRVGTDEFAAWSRVFEARGVRLPRRSEWAFFVSAWPGEAGGAAA
jgi:hypothetical protein